MMSINRKLDGKVCTYQCYVLLNIKLLLLKILLYIYKCTLISHWHRRQWLAEHSRRGHRGRVLLWSRWCPGCCPHSCCCSGQPPGRGGTKGSQRSDQSAHLSWVKVRVRVRVQGQGQGQCSGSRSGSRSGSGSGSRSRSRSWSGSGSFY